MFYIISALNVDSISSPNASVDTTIFQFSLWKITSEKSYVKENLYFMEKILLALHKLPYYDAILLKALSTF